MFADALAGRTLTFIRGQLALTADATIDGDRGDDGVGVTVSAGGASRVLLVGGVGTEATLEAVTIADGRAAAAAGGGVRLAAGNSLVMDRCALSGNEAENGGGDLRGCRQPRRSPRAPLPATGRSTMPAASATAAACSPSATPW